MDLGTAWCAPDYDDSGWSNGVAKLGYGGDGEMTPLSFGTNSSLKHPTYCFRHAFTVTRAVDYTNLTARLIRFSPPSAVPPVLGGRVTILLCLPV